MLLESSSTQFQYDVLANSKNVLVHMGIPASLTCIAMQPIVETVDTWKWRYPVVEIKAAA